MIIHKSICDVIPKKKRCELKEIFGARGTIRVSQAMQKFFIFDRGEVSSIT